MEGTSLCVYYDEMYYVWTHVNKLLLYAQFGLFPHVNTANAILSIKLLHITSLSMFLDIHVNNK